MKVTKFQSSIAVFVLLVILALIQAGFKNTPQARDTDFVIETREGKKIYLYGAETASERKTGLGGREALSEDEGMLFIFPVSEYHGIWMKGMRFPLDIIWVGQDLKVVDIKTEVSPATYPEVFYPGEKARYVVEVPGGAAQERGIEVGEQLILKKY